jgi:hypothetical protein
MKKRTAIMAGLVDVSIGLQVCQMTPAIAGDPTGGGGTEQMVQTPADAARSAAKMAAADAYLGGTVTPLASASAAALGPAATSLTSWSTWAAMRPASVRHATSAYSLATTAATATSMSDAVAHSPQQQYYYCGPASGYMILATENAGASARNGNSLTQAHVAGAAHMKTNQNFETAWASHLFRIGLNHWLSDSDTGFYVDQPTPTNAQFEHALLMDIPVDMPFGVSTYEAPGGIHYNHHPVAQQVGHWIVAQGYSDSGSTGSFDDPAAKSSALSSAWDNVNSNFTASVATFNPDYVAYHGITW